MMSNNQYPHPHTPRHANTHPAPKWVLPLHIPGCVKSPCRTPAVVSTVSRVEPIPRIKRMVGGRRTAGQEREVRERLGAQPPANTRARSISPRPPDGTSHCPASAEKHTHTPPPCHLLYPLYLAPLLCSPVRLLGGWGGGGDGDGGRGVPFTVKSCGL